MSEKKIPPLNEAFDGARRYHVCSWVHYPKHEFFHALVFDRKLKMHHSIKKDGLKVEPSNEEKLEIINLEIERRHEEQEKQRQTDLL